MFRVRAVLALVAAEVAGLALVLPLSDPLLLDLLGECVEVLAGGQA